MTNSTNLSASDAAPLKDVIETLHGATIQHGPLNRRIYLMSMNDANAKQLTASLDELAKKNEYTKIFAKVKAANAGPFLAAGYIREAAVPGYFCGAEDAVFLCKYFSRKRSVENASADIEEIVKDARASIKKAPGDRPERDDIRVRKCTPADADAMAALYRRVFESYPFPIDKPDYLLATMETHVSYFCAEKNGRIIALSSAEADKKNSAVEMTDFATCPDHRGLGTAGRLLTQMEVDMREEGVKTLYTIARAGSRPVNRLFGSAGYLFGGILVNNTHIGGQIESMTVWYKSLFPEHSKNGL
jgi:beta-lysine N6-acetyltransferase